MRNRLITEKKRRDEEDHGCGPHSACELFGVDISEVLARQLRNQGGDGGMGPMGAPGRQVASPPY
jgi:hypothetical protein